jgi:hypothetical protein
VIRGGQQQELTLNLGQLAQEADNLAAQSPPSAAPVQAPAGLPPLAVPPATDQPLIAPIPPPAEGSGAGEVRQ